MQKNKTSSLKTRTNAFTACLVAAVLLCAAVLPCFAAPSGGDFCFTVATDTHVRPVSSFGDVSAIQNMPDETLYHHATNQGLMYYESEAILRSFLETFVASDSAFLLLCGDFSTGAEKQNHRIVAGILAEYEEKGGKPIFVINGNHDVAAVSTEKEMDIADFKQIYRQFGYDEAIAVDAESGSYTADLYGDYRLLAIDSCKHGTGTGLITKGVQKFIKEQAKKAKEDGKHLIAMMHHPLLKHFGLEPTTKVTGSTIGIFASQLASYGIKYVFNGHMHINDIAQKTTSGGLITNVMTEALITAPNSFRTVSVTPDSFAVATDYVRAVDTQDLAAGYTEEQLSLIEDDYPAFARGYFAASYHYWINRNLGDAGVVNGLLKLDPDSRLYGTLSDFMENIGRYVNLPLYANDTPEADTIGELGKRIGIAIPESGYTYVHEFLDDVVWDFYCGTSDPDGKSTELSLLLPAAKTVLFYAVNDMIASGKRLQLKDLLDLLQDRGVLSPFTNTAALANAAADAITLALVSPLFAGIVGDYSAPDDVTYTGEGYASQTQTQPIARILAMLKEFFERLFALLKSPSLVIG